MHWVAMTNPSIQYNTIQLKGLEVHYGSEGPHLAVVPMQKNNLLRNVALYVALVNSSFEFVEVIYFILDSKIQHVSKILVYLNLRK